MYVCFCKNITESQAREALERGCLDELGIGSGCGECIKSGGIKMNKYDDMRNKRNALLIESDWTQLANANLTLTELDHWDKYRQELRDFPDEIYQQELATGQCVENPIWPTKPEE